MHKQGNAQSKGKVAKLLDHKQKADKLRRIYKTRIID